MNYTRPSHSFDYSAFLQWLRVNSDSNEINPSKISRWNQLSPEDRLHYRILAEVGKDITIMHPGPVNRGIEISTDVADSGQSIILNQVENGVAIRMAILYLLAGIAE